MPRFGITFASAPARPCLRVGKTVLKKMLATLKIKSQASVAQIIAGKTQAQYPAPGGDSANNRLSTMIANPVTTIITVPGRRCRTIAPSMASMHPPTTIGTYQATMSMEPTPMIFVILD